MGNLVHGRVLGTTLNRQDTVPQVTMKSSTRLQELFELLSISFVVGVGMCACSDIGTHITDNETSSSFAGNNGL